MPRQRDRARRSSEALDRADRHRPARASSARRSRSAAAAAASPHDRGGVPRGSSRAGSTASPIGQVLLDQSVLGWGEFELEVMRDHNDNVVIVCSIENIDPMGVHTGDSVTVAPQQTLTDRALPAAARPGDRGHPRGRRRDRRLQRAVRGQPGDRGDPRHRDEPARVALVGAGVEGHRLPDRQDRRAAGGRLRAGGDRQRHHAAHAGELRADDRLRRRQVAAVRVREVPRRRRRAVDAHEVASARRWRSGAPSSRRSPRRCARASSTQPRADGSTRGPAERARAPGADRYDVLLEAFRRGATIEEVHARTQIDPWFLRELRELALDPEAPFAGERSLQVGRHLRRGVRGADAVLLLGLGAPRGRTRSSAATAPSVVILGAGPNRIGQGIEFDYCCVHAAMTVRESGRDAVMINCNPETVSTDYDTSDRLYFEPLTLEDVLGGRRGRAARGRHRPVRRPDAAEARRRPGRGRRAAARHERRRDRPRRGPRPLRRRCSARLGYEAPPYATGARRSRRRSSAADDVGYPLLVRPSATCSAAARWRSSTRATAWRTTCARTRRATGARSSSTASWRTRSRSTSTRCATARTSGSAGSCSTSRRPASTPATAPACCRRTRSAPRCSTRSASTRAGSRWGSASSA